ncbi:hypothetical protein C1S99_24235 [Vibrio parahaemolyticus]|nr:hypothetical protein [Vibrio parahaemolyticus]KGT35236.1 hypothetical protein HC02_08285 [Vibrio parahaemolyticus]ODW99350.1 hypothetical protein BBL95_01170 [Vibrio parahaemolyticus]ODX02735.1 hypothetical protein BBL98_19110 [Vibrio parahaemolyticus]ODX06581.1 hypothetical protein BBL96_13125 [Vibrio parahaemolyticus]
MDINRLFEKNKGKEEEKYELIKRKSPSISARASNVAVSERFELSIRIATQLASPIGDVPYKDQ